MSFQQNPVFQPLDVAPLPKAVILDRRDVRKAALEAEEKEVDGHRRTLAEIVEKHPDLESMQSLRAMQAEANRCSRLGALYARARAELMKISNEMQHAPAPGVFTAALSALQGLAQHRPDEYARLAGNMTAEEKREALRLRRAGGAGSKRGRDDSKEEEEEEESDSSDEEEQPRKRPRKGQQKPQKPSQKVPQDQQQEVPQDQQQTRQQRQQKLAARKNKNKKPLPPKQTEEDDLADRMASVSLPEICKVEVN